MRGVAPLPSVHFLMDELSGANETGIRSFQDHVPFGKSYLSNVLLSGNPAEQRDLDAKLEKIQKERCSREKTLEWAQKKFFLKQVFDNDLNLRFTKQREYVQGSPNKKQKGAAEKPETVILSPVYEKHSTATGSRISISLDSDEVRILPRILSPKKGIFSKDRQNRDQTSDSDMPRSKQNADKTRDNISETYRLSSLPTISAFVPSLSDARDTTKVRRLTFSGPDLSHQPLGGAIDKGVNKKIAGKEMNLTKMSSLPNLSKKVPEVFSPRSSLSASHDHLKSRGLLRSRDNGQNDQGEVILCKDEVICKIAHILPMSLMIRANQSINRVIGGQKDSLLRACRQEGGRNSFSDPRWTKLAQTLGITIETEPYSKRRLSCQQ